MANHLQNEHLINLHHVFLGQLRNGFPRVDPAPLPSTVSASSHPFPALSGATHAWAHLASSSYRVVFETTSARLRSSGTGSR
eukprot:38758-Rhodomonas_salina.1